MTRKVQKRISYDDEMKKTEVKDDLPPQNLSDNLPDTIGKLEKLRGFQKEFEITTNN